jgi:S1-C subfamily serine protease
MSEVASTPTVPLFSEALSTLVADVASSVIALHSHHARFSGFVWRPGLIVTADEALPEDGEVTVMAPGGETLAASVVGRDPTTDVALLRINGENLRPVTFTSGSPRAGELALVVGMQDASPTVALGVVSLAASGWRSLRGGEIDARIELAVAMRGSAEGGVVVDATGRVIGMAVYGPRRQVLVIPSATIDRVAAQLESHGRIARGYLGLGLQPVGLNDGTTGIMVMGVDARGPGAEADIRQGDVIVAWDEQQIGSLQTLLRALTADKIGAAVRLSLMRAGEPMTVSVTIGERPRT